MPLTDTSTIILVVALVVVAALLVWLSLSMAAAESAVGRVTRAGLNNKILEVQTDTETSQFIRMKKIGKIHTVQRLIANRYATSGSCAFFRITCNVFDGVLVACVASLLDAPIWLQLLCGFLFALIVGIVSVLVRPRSAGASKPIDIMLNSAGHRDHAVCEGGRAEGSEASLQGIGPVRRRGAGEDSARTGACHHRPPGGGQ